MVAPRKTRKIFCTIVRVSEDGERSQGHASRFSTRPSRLLPWSDPYLAKLVRNLQDEVRNERASANCLRAELDPLPAIDREEEWTDSLGWRF
ncbi:MAG: hypothetical protein GXP28_10755 [Planctomycetes bacterium]|nr:hypothetical protein [Planctomycetota bacterium]